MREDNKLVYQKLQEFRKKYNELVNSKASLQEQLLKSEEEKLRISKALVDYVMKIKRDFDFETFETKNQVPEEPFICFCKS